MNVHARQLQVEIEDLLTQAAAKAAALAVLVADDATGPVEPATPEPARSGLTDDAAFYNWLRSNAMLGPKISPAEFQGCQSILAACAAAGHPLSWTAYELGTGYHETAHTMQPINELGGAAYFVRLYDINGQRASLAKQMGNTAPGDGIKFHGRGFVQLTWKSNYEKAGKKLGFDLVGDPELALDPKIAGEIMASGMEEGWFSGKKLGDYLPKTKLATKAQFVAARPIVNGTDRADLVAGYAVNFQDALAAGGWVG
jgi:putative chitinase